MCFQFVSVTFYDLVFDIYKYTFVQAIFIYINANKKIIFRNNHSLLPDSSTRVPLKNIEEFRIATDMKVQDDGVEKLRSLFCMFRVLN